MVLSAVVTLVVAFGLQYRDQITSYVTHLKGSPTNTDPYVPFPADDRPVLRTGDVLIVETGSVHAWRNLRRDPMTCSWILRD